MEENERQLIERARHDAEAFGLVFEKYYGPLLSYTSRRVGSIEVAEDVVAETFLKAFSKLWQFKWQGAPFSAWLYRIAGNEIRMHHRRPATKARSLEAMLEEDATLEPASGEALEAELIEAEEEFARGLAADRAVALLSSLPDHYAEALALRFLEEKSVAEVAEILKKPEGTVKSLLSRGVAKLRDLMAAQPDVGTGISTKDRAAAV